MPSVSSKIAYSIIITGLFIIVVFIAATYEILNSNFYIVLIPLTAFLLLFGFAIGQKFALPVKELLKDADYLSRGNIKIRFSQKDRDELGQLAKVFNRVAEKFEESRSEVETLDTKVKLRTQTLEGIINILEQKVKNMTMEFQKAVGDLERVQSQIKLKDEEIKGLRTQISELSSRKRKKDN